MERNKEIDFAKGIAALLVIWGHTIECFAEGQLWIDRVHMFIYSFHMPLFMFLSGYVFFMYSLKKRWWEIAEKSFYLLIPILIWGTVAFIRRDIIGENATFSFNNWVMSVTVAGLWFLYAVILNNIITISIFKLVNSSFFRSILFIFIFILMIISCEFIHSMRLITYMYPYFMGGGIAVSLHNKNLNMLKQYASVAITLLACLFPILLMYYSENAYIYVSGIAISSSEIGISAQIINNAYRWIIGFAGIAFCYRVLKEKNLPILITDRIVWIGKRSLQFYALNEIVYWVVPMIKSKINLVYRDSLGTHCIILGITVIEVGIIVLINKCIEKSKVLEFILFGRKQ